MAPQSEQFMNLLTNTRTALTDAVNATFNTAGNTGGPTVGLVPSPPNTTFPPNFFLRADGTWAEVDAASITGLPPPSPAVVLNTDLTNTAAVSFQNIFSTNSQYSVFDVQFNGIEPTNTNPPAFLLMRYYNTGSSTANASSIYLVDLFSVSGAGNSSIGVSGGSANISYSNIDVSGGGYGLSGTHRIYIGQGALGRSGGTITYSTISTTYRNTAGNLIYVVGSNMFNSGVQVTGFLLGFNTGGGFGNFTAGNLRVVAVA